ncbi:hypothetical protein CEXT_127991 [Caerostris extrusa]|uniref:Uncharacterized protein n=1 Tax=Caerostris extrusa TaxID=172846 RepID=A0AAV4PHR4_CAEEX|nr:hypothetical protein CEXT_127991 [Caerostris extrusa]
MEFYRIPVSQSQKPIFLFLSEVLFGLYFSWTRFYIYSLLQCLQLQRAVPPENLLNCKNGRTFSYLEKRVEEENKKKEDRGKSTLRQTKTYSSHSFTSAKGVGKGKLTLRVFPQE